MNMQIFYIASDNRYISGLSTYFEMQSCVLKPYNHGCERNKNFILLIFSPLKCEKVRISPESIWKKGLAKVNPNAILINAGFEEIQGTNYFDILSPPARWSDFMAGTKRVGEKWVPVFTGGMKMQEKLVRFFQGHGMESLTDELYVIRRKTLALDRAINKHNLSYYDAASEAFVQNDIWGHWELFLSRWSHYFPLFQYLPFAEQMEHIDKSLKRINPFFENRGQNESLFLHLNCAQEVDSIHKTLFSIEKNYVKD